MAKTAVQGVFIEQNPVTQLSKIILNNSKPPYNPRLSVDQYERKGRLSKKSLNSDTFKERWFVLQQEHLFYYKSEKLKDKNFNLIILLDAHLRKLDYEFLIK